MKIRLILGLVLSSLLLRAQVSIIETEYWFDSDYNNTVVLPANGSSYNLNTSIPTNNLNTGLHTLQLRFRQSDSTYSATISKPFLKLKATGNSTKEIIGYEYWFDSDYNSKVILPANGSSYNLNTNIATNNLSTGLHYFHLRFRQSDSTYSATISKPFLKLNATGSGSNSKEITAYEYWFDDVFASRTTKNLSQGASVQLTTDLQLSTLADGLHSFHIRFRDNSGMWSSVKSSFVLTKQPLARGHKTNKITALRYWTDTAMNKVDTLFVQAAQKTFIFEQLDLSSVDTGTHYFHMQFADARGIWSTTVTDTFYQIGEPEITHYTPHRGGNTGDVTLSIYGNGFAKKTEVKLTRSGYPDIVVSDSLISIDRGKKIRATLDLRGKDTGDYHLVVTVPNDTVMTIKNGFKIEEGKKDFWLQLTGPPALRTNTNTSVSLEYGNSGNVNITGLPVYLAVPKETEITFQTPALTIRNDSIFRVDSLFSVEVDSLFEPDITYSVYIVLVPGIAPGSNGSIDLDIKTSTNTTVRYWAGRPWYSSPVEPSWEGCAMAILDQNYWNVLGQALDLITLKGSSKCFFNYIRGKTDPFIEIMAEGGEIPSDYQHPYLPFVKGKAGWVVDMGISLFEVNKDFYKCMKTVIIPEPKLKSIAKKSVGRIVEKAAGAYNLGRLLGDKIFDGLDDCGFLDHLVLKYYDFPVVQSIDPNDKYGSFGGGALSYITPHSPLPYTIRFENDSSATASAQTIRIVDSLDTAVYDLNSFRLQSVQIGDTLLNIPPGNFKNEMYIDFRNSGNNVIVKLDAGIDLTTGVATWLFTTLDPVSLQPTTDPFAGFLPPNITSPEGEGAVSFSISLKDSLPNNTVIQNKAYIFFDNNAPIITNNWSNTIDKLKPHSNVHPLFSSIPDTLIPLSWSGTDTSSGIAYYSIYVAKNEQDYQLWISETADTYAVFKGRTDSTYRFYSVATDTAGNKEIAPLSHDAITTLIPPPPEPIIELFPNPTTGITMLRGIGYQGTVSLSIFAFDGSRVQHHQVDAVSGIFEKQLNLSSSHTGLYLIRVDGQSFGKTMRLFVE